jgi:hypothetical protein
MVDGMRVDPTPLRDYVIPADQGQVRVRIIKAGYVDIDTTLNVVAGENLSLSGLRLEKETTSQMATLQFSSSPGGTRVFINDQPMGETGALGALTIEVPVGDIVVRVEKDNFEPWEERFLARAGESLTISPTLESTSPTITTTNDTRRNDGDPPPPVRNGTLTVNIGSGNGSIKVASENCQVGQACTVGAGNKNVSCGDKTFRVEVPAGGSKQVACYFEHVIVVQARQADGVSPIYGSISINGQKVGEGQDVPLKRGPGTYTVAVSKALYTAEPSTQSVTIEPALEAQREIVMFRLTKQ